MNNQSASIGKRLTSRRKRFASRNATRIIPPDIIITETEDENDEWKDDIQSDLRTHVEQTLSYDPNVALEQFAKLNYVERYINANFEHGKCFMKEIKKRYEHPGKFDQRQNQLTRLSFFSSGKKNVTIRLKLYIDLVSDLMFNFHMVHCLNLRAQIPNLTASTYAYVYSHKPTFKARSLFRDHLKTLPNMIGHFAELGNYFLNRDEDEFFLCEYLDYVFGVPLARNFRRIHTNVNMSYYNYSNDEENFSREIMRYWSNFIKTGFV